MLFNAFSEIFSKGASASPPKPRALFDAYILDSAMSSIESHAIESASGEGESMGLLLGRPHSFKGHNYTLVTDYLTGPNVSSSTSVRFDDSAFPSISRELFSRADSLVVGWAHSHPGFGCFLSPTDIETQLSYFNKPFHIALVVDPLRREKGSCLKRVFSVPEGSGNYESLSFAVVRRRVDEPV